MAILSFIGKPISNIFLTIINPIKQEYKSISKDIEEKSNSYIFQQESIERLSHENRILTKRLLEQQNYINSIKTIYKTLPNLTQTPIGTVSLSQAISYVKLNTFSQIILTKPKGVVEDKIYGLVQNNVVAGTAKVKNGQLYGYLTSDDACRFSVFIGDEKIPGIAVGTFKNNMSVKFIPNWNNINKGDKVYTSGLDGIFYANIPVGIVDSIDKLGAYTVAHIKTFSDIYNPDLFFLIDNAKDKILDNFDKEKDLNILPKKKIQPIVEKIKPKKPKKKVKTKVKQKKEEERKKTLLEISPFDLF